MNNKRFTEQLNIKQHLTIYKIFLKLDIRRILMYPWNFVLGNFGYFIDSIANLFVLHIILNNVSTIGGLSQYEMLFFYSFLMISSSLWEIFFVTTLEIPYLINTGELDIFLLRPLNVLFQFLIFQIDEESVFEFLFGMLIMIYSLINLSIPITLSFIFRLVLFMVSSLLIRQSIYLALSSISFWTISNDGLKSALWELSQMSQYPLSIYPKFLRSILIVIPFGLLGYYPVISLLTYGDMFNLSTLFHSISGYILLALVYHTIWKAGLKNYSSAGA